MKILYVLMALSLAAAEPSEPVFREALDLYEKGMFGRSRDLFRSLENDSFAQSYALLCTVRLNETGYEDAVAEYLSANPQSVLQDEIFYNCAANMFNDGDYKGAAEYLDMMDTDRIKPGLKAEYDFRRGFCHFASGEMVKARRSLSRVADAGQNNYTAISQYLLGYIDYLDSDSEGASNWFAMSAQDPRFESLSKFYLVECHFLQKDYDYVISGGEEIFQDSPSIRQQRLSRLMSEAYLVKGDSGKAKEYFEKESKDRMTRSDYFHAGSVMYSTGDYDGAVANFSQMGERTDSLGQIANYQMGYSYVRKANKIAALNAFNEAAKYSYSPDIQEDAAFNYAKLAFDVNHDANGFRAYLDRYSTSSKGEQIYNYMALVNLVNHDYQGAINAYDNIETLNDIQKVNYVKANYLRAHELISAGSWSGAIPYLKASGFYLPHTDRFNQLSRYWLAESFFKTGEYHQSRAIMTDLYNLSALDGLPEGSLLPYNIACCFYNVQDWDSAAKWFDTYISSPAPALKKDARIRRADCDFMRKDYGRAAEMYAAAVQEFGTEDLYPVYRHGLACGLSGNLKRKAEVLTVSKSASAAADYRDESLYELGRAYLDLKDYPAAASTFSFLRTTSQDSVMVAKALIGRGMANRNSAEYEAALADYKKVVELLPGSGYSQDALLAIESIYAAQHCPEKYLEYVESRNLDSGKSPAEKEKMYFNAAEQLYLAQNYSKAIPLLKTFIETHPLSPNLGDAWFYLADSYRYTGDKEAAVDAYSKVVGLGGEKSFVESAALECASLNYSMERYPEAYAAYEALLGTARMEVNRGNARVGMMRSAYRAAMYDKAISAADELSGDEALYIKAKSLLLTSRRVEALDIFGRLASNPSTAEGAEARYILIQDALDRADFDAVEKMVYDFSRNCGSQSYWLAKAYIALGDSFLARGNSSQAKVTYESIRDGYSPSGEPDDILDNVKLRLSRIAE